MSSISRDGKHVQLWDLLTDVPLEPCRDMLESRRDQGQRVKDLLNQVSRIHGQEMSLEVKPDGVTITVFSCYGGSVDDYLLQVHIPKDKTTAIQFYIGPGHEAVLYQRRAEKTKVGEALRWVYKFIGRTRVFKGRKK